MDNLNQIEIQNIRHICGHTASFCDKINYFKTLTQDQNITEVKTVLKRKPIKKTAVSVVVPAPKNTVIKKKRVFGNKK